VDRLRSFDNCSISVFIIYLMILSAMNIKKNFILILFLLLSISSVQASSYNEVGNGPWGIDQELPHLHRQEAVPFPQPLSASQKVCRSMIRFFQVYISPCDGPRSSFWPSSSQYTWEAIEKYGALKGIALGCDRLMRENGENWIYPLEERGGVLRKVDPIR